MEALLPIIDGEDKSSSFKNCLRNNYRHLRKWAKRTLTTAFRIYDHDIPYYPVVVDFYGGRFAVQCFVKRQDENEVPDWLLEEVNNAIISLFDVSEELIYWRNRIRRARTEQYEKSGEEGEFFPVFEYGAKFLINLTDYLDTGLFLDHRETRQMVKKLAKGKSLLNLFAYTCSFSVQAALGGASFTRSVDLSNTYTLWGRENFRLNHLADESHSIIRADCLKFLDSEITSGATYDLIIIDPPTLSRSKKMDQLFDIQVDYPSILSKALRLLAPQGTLFFSTNSRRFVLDETLFPNAQVQEISAKTLPLDFRDPRIHRCWRFSSLT